MTSNMSPVHPHFVMVADLAGILLICINTRFYNLPHAQAAVDTIDRKIVKIAVLGMR